MHVSAIAMVIERVKDGVADADVRHGSLLVLAVHLFLSATGLLRLSWSESKAISSSLVPVPNGYKRVFAHSATTCQ